MTQFEETAQPDLSDAPLVVPLDPEAEQSTRPVYIGGSDLPQLTPGQERIVRSLAIVSLIFGLYWIYWRWTETMNPEALVSSVALVLAETWAYISCAVRHECVAADESRAGPAPPRGVTVDVFITCYDEPLEVVRRTAIGARAIRYPHRTYILDDGKREEVRDGARSWASATSAGRAMRTRRRAT